MSDKIKLYRVQDDKGKDPFKPGFSKKWVRPRLDQLKLKPWMAEFPDLIKSTYMTDKGIWVGSACVNLKQLKRWFSKKEYKTLLKYGYGAYAIDVDTILAQSAIQCVFTNDKPTFIDAVPIKLY